MVIQSELRAAASASKSRRKLRRLGVFDLPPRTSGNALLRTLPHTGPLLCRIASGELLGFSELCRRPKTGSPTSENTSCLSFEDVQRVAMRMGRMATWSDESLLRRPPQEDRGCHRARHAQGRSAPYVRDRDLHPQALRYQAPKRQAPGALPGSRQTAQDRRASRQAPRRGSEGAPVRHPKGALRVRASRKWGFGEPLYHVPCHSQDRPHPQKGGPSATERDEFLRAAWRLMVAAEVDPSQLVFVDEMGIHTSLAPLYGYAPKGERLRLGVPRNLKARTRRFWPRSPPAGWARRWLWRAPPTGESSRPTLRARPCTHLRSRRGGDHGQPSRPQAQEGEGADRGEGLRANLPTRLLSGPQPDRRSV